MLTELDDRLSKVKRWGILRTINQQSVAEHVFNVVRICETIGPWFGILGPRLLALLQGALHHDDYEAITGDIPSPAKGYLQETEKRVDTGAQMWYTGLDPELKAVIKLADLLEAFHFSSLELKMGNRYVIKHHRGLVRKINALISAHPEWSREIQENVHDWMALIQSKTSDLYG